MKVDPVSEKMSTPSQNWTPDGGREHVFDNLDFLDEDERSSEKVEKKSSVAMVRPTSGNGADGLGVDGKTGSERRGGRR